MTTTDCGHFREILLRLQGDPQTAIPDGLALHLDECNACRQLFDTSKVDMDPDVFELIPAEARKQIMNRLAAARGGRPRLGAAVGLVAAVVLVIAGSWLLVDREPSVPDKLLTSLVDDHIRYLNHPDRQPAADREVLADYLEPYVDFPVELPALPDAEFAGARRCMLLGRRAMVAFYDTAAGPVSYFVVVANDDTALPGSPCPGTSGISCLTRAGYHVIHWQHAGLLHTLVGEEASSLMSLADACGGGASVEEPS